MQEFLKALRDGAGPEEALAECNPLTELLLEGRGKPRWLSLRYYRIERSGVSPGHLLCMLEDITEAKWLADTIAKSSSENVLLRVIAEDPELFRELLWELRGILQEAHALAERLTLAEGRQAVIEGIFRGVHTAKGLAGSFGMPALAEIASSLESRLEVLRGTGGLSDKEIADTKTALDSLSEGYTRVVQETADLLGSDEDEAAGLPCVRVPSEVLRRHMERIRGMAVEIARGDPVVAEFTEEMLRCLASLCYVPAQRGLARCAKLAASLLERLGKEATFRFTGGKTLIDCDVARELNTPLLHLLRNALDHGMEPPEERKAKGKATQGLVILDVSLHNADLVVVVADDGRGLDGEKLKQAALRKGWLAPEEVERLTPEDALGLVLRSGLSTAESTTDISGRGVGLDAVKASLGKLGGTLDVQSSPGRGARFTLTVPVGAAAPFCAVSTLPVL